MKKLSLVFLFTVISLAGYPCSGIWYSCGDYDDLIDDAIANCCAESGFTIIDCDKGSMFVSITEDGPNASCIAPE
ncbi:hypothetical protein Belba_3371 [Belliella baltica DSM 15883]|uniref:Uncharacterized protein n=1 Tax=Belliella baltica (strain DSM 15883 / CIP 108006 / LMG 21964 / BA134) TaxID=866536 RepID=I3Z9F6_BELBD|nr:hypothetical protein [Belliella baltica]AFL85874.1 hypothetical protein Belba_3371 [Belliella baltica DSM 15883]